jgi:o-succinylbenzoate---CoA ligase
MAANMESIILNGKKFGPKSGDAIHRHLVALSNETREEIVNFLNDWWSKSESIQVQTSGSTGAPKLISLSKNTIRESARKTLKFFKLKSGDTALLCLPTKFIAGKLMLVRAIEGGLKLFVTEPELNPLQNLKNEKINFAALIPSQLWSALQNETTTKSLKKIDHLLIGGGDLMPRLTDALKQFKNPVYLSFGMTETATHIALRQVGGPTPDLHFTALEGVTFKLDNRHCLVIDADHLPEPIITNDLVLIKNPQHFEWLGRIDNAINSGGIKHIPELIEKEFEPYIKSPFFITGLKDELLGQKMALIVEGDAWPKGSFDALIDRLSESLNKFELPREVHFVKKFTLTPTNKIDRKKSIEILGN